MKKNPAPPVSPAPGGVTPNKSPDFPYLNHTKPSILPATVSHTARTIPFGEEMAAQHAGGAYATRYKFNGKELDPQTGYYYYGARYYEPAISRWPEGLISMMKWTHISLINFLFTIFSLYHNVPLFPLDFGIT